MEVAGTKSGLPSTLLAPWPSFLAAYTKHFWLLAVEFTLLETIAFSTRRLHSPSSGQSPASLQGFSAFPLLTCTPSRLLLPAPHYSQTAQEGLNSSQRQLHTLNPDSQH